MARRMELFFDRYDAGRQLASKLESYRGVASAVLALPRGGVLVGYEIATALRLPLDIVITRKIGHPMNREVAVCAVTEDGRRVCNDGGIYSLDEEWIQNESIIAQREANRRRLTYDIKEPESIEGKTVIVTDDGIATGLTMKAALLTVRARNPKKIILAVPVCPPELREELEALVDSVVLLDTSKDFRGAVGAYYAQFPEVTDSEVVSCLKDALRLQAQRSFGLRSQLVEVR